MDNNRKNKLKNKCYDECKKQKEQKQYNSNEMCKNNMQKKNKITLDISKHFNESHSKGLHFRAL